jgi:hypothetical protein
VGIRYGKMGEYSHILKWHLWKCNSCKPGCHSNRTTNNTSRVSFPHTFLIASHISKIDSAWHLLDFVYFKKLQKTVIVALDLKWCYQLWSSVTNLSKKSSRCQLMIVKFASKVNSRMHFWPGVIFDTHF